jgi:hypothetical protein
MHETETRLLWNISAVPKTKSGMCHKNISNSWKLNDAEIERKHNCMKQNVKM